MASDSSLTGDDVRNAVFAKPSVGKRGYNPAEVDEFLQRLADALDGSGALTAAEVDNAIFQPQHWPRSGYREDEVDALLDAAASVLRRRAAADRSAAVADGSAARHEPISGYQVRNAAFRRSIGAGYDISAVDAFRDRAARGLDGLGPPITREEVRAERFPPAKRWQRGYDGLEVQALLDRIVVELDRRGAGW